MRGKNMKHFFFSNPEKASSMITVVLAMGFLGTGAMLMTAQLVRNQNFSASAEKYLDKAILQKAISLRLECPEKLSSLSGCNGKTPIEIEDEEGNVFIKSSGEGRKAGGWNIRAVCKSAGSGKEVHIQYAKLKSGRSVSSNVDSAFIADYQTKKIHKWKDLYDGSICPNSLDFGNKLSHQCIRKRSQAYKNDFVTWCTEEHPKLYSCAQVDDEAPAGIYTLSECTSDGECMARRMRPKKFPRDIYRRFGPERMDLGPDGVYYERVVKKSSDKEINGCWMYDSDHKHTLHRADIMCCKAGEPSDED